MNEFREDIKQLEKNILKLINEFETEYNCYVCDIDLLYNGGRYYNGEMHANTIHVIVDYKLND